MCEISKSDTHCGMEEVLDKRTCVDYLSSTFCETIQRGIYFNIKDTSD